MAGFIRRQSISNLTDAILGARPDKNTSLIRSRRASSGFNSFSALLVARPSGRGLSVSPTALLSSFCPSMSKSYFPKSAPGRLTCLRLCAPGTCLVPCSVSNRTPVSGWRVTHRDIIVGNISSHLLHSDGISCHFDNEIVQCSFPSIHIAHCIS